jgi:Uncharacterised nucleotidyltransferase
LNSIRAEAELIITLSRQELTPAAEAHARELAAVPGSLDWGLFLDQVTEHRVASLVSRNIDELRAQDRPLPVEPSVAATLRAVRLCQQMSNRLMLGELRNVLAAAERSSIRVVPRKGGHLAQTVYREQGLRPMEDLDLLADPADVPALTVLLAELGYQQGKLVGGVIQPLDRRESLYWRLFGSDLPHFSKLVGDSHTPVIRIDVSISLALPGKGYDIPVTEVLRRAVPCQIDGQQVSFLAPEDVLIDLCSHIYKKTTVLRFMRQGKHRRLVKHVDIVEFIQSCSGDFSWPTLLNRTDKYGIHPQVYYTLAHVNMLFPGEIPSEVLNTLGSSFEHCPAFLDEYGQWDLPTTLTWQRPFMDRFFSRLADQEIPPSKSLV